MNEIDSAARRPTTALSATTGFGLALVVSGGIVLQRVLGSTAANAIAANTVTTLVAVAAAVTMARTYFATFDSAARDVRVANLAASQAIGALLGVLAIHALVWRGLDAHPWLREHPRQLVNDLVAVFGVLAFVWGSARRAIRPHVMLAGLTLVLGYELTAAYWHIDAPVPMTRELAWSVQRFVGSEVTASGIGVLAFRLLLL